MSYDQLLSILKGSERSGNYGHLGRPGHLGGSKPGGGHGIIGVKPNDNTNTIKRLAYELRTSNKFRTADYKDMGNLVEHYNLYEKCGKGVIECDELKRYTGSGYENCNAYLRGLEMKEWNEPPGPDDVDEFVSSIDNVFDKSPRLPKAYKAFRGVDPIALSGLQPGDEFVDDGFVSTSVDSHKAFSGTKLEIRVPKGARALYVEEVSNLGHERELLLDRSSKFRILKAEYAKYDKDKRGNPIMRSAVLELIPND